MALGKALISYDNSGNIQLQSDGLNVVKAIPDDFGIKVIAAVGPGRIGKSSLLNQLSRKDSFGVGSTTTRVTKGIWIDFTLDYAKTIATVFIDVEGFGDPSRDDASASDSRLMFIVCQMCDVVIYNTKGVYDNELVKKLELVCHMFKRYRKYHEVFSTPVLIVCQRDFDLDIPEHPDAELRNVLGQENDECFRSMKVFFFERPTERAKLRNLRKMQDADLDKEYIRRRRQLEIYLEEEAKPLCTNKGSRITAKVFVEAIRKIFNAVIEDNLDGISKNLVGLLREQNDVMIKEAVNKYTQKMKINWSMSTIPEFLHKDIQVSLKIELKERLYDVDGKNNSLLALFEVKTESAFQSISEKKAKQQLEKLNSTIESNYANNSYFVIGGSHKFKVDMDSLEKTYMQCGNLGPKAVVVWKDYKKTLLERRQIIQTKENILLRERESARRLRQQRIERERLYDLMIEQAEERDQMIRRQENMDRQRIARIAENVINIIAGIAQFGLRLLFRRLIR